MVLSIGVLYKATIKPRFKGLAGVFSHREHKVIGKIRRADKFASGLVLVLAPDFCESWDIGYLRKFYTLKRLSRAERLLMEY